MLQLTFPLYAIIIETTLFYQVSSQVLTLNLWAGSCLKACAGKDSEAVLWLNRKDTTIDYLCLLWV